MWGKNLGEEHEAHSGNLPEEGRLGEEHGGDWARSGNCTGLVKEEGHGAHSVGPADEEHEARSLGLTKEEHEARSLGLTSLTDEEHEARSGGLTEEEHEARSCGLTTALEEVKPKDCLSLLLPLLIYPP